MRVRTISWFLALLAMVLSVPLLLAQETTGGMQGTVKDATGAVVPNAEVVVTGTSLVGKKTINTDAAGYYRFANLPPGTYTVEVSAKGFKSIKQGGLVLEVGHLPTIDVSLEIGSTSEVIEVSGAAPIIDVTTETTQTNITHDVVDNVPHGRSFQSVIQFAPSARNEPLQGSTAANGSGGMVPGSATNGNAFGYSVGGASDAENAYLVEGQQTANLIGGFSHTNVPFDFIQEVAVKSTGQEAQYGGALGGVVNVVMRKGSNNYHGSVFSQYETADMDGSPNAFSRYDPNQNLSAPGDPLPNGIGTNNTNGYIDPAYQNYQPIRRKMFDVFPGFTFGGPIMKNRIFGFVGFNPELYGQTRTVDMSGFQPGLGKLPFSRNIQTYYTNARVDAEVSQKVRLFGSWLYQYQRVHGVNLPTDDSTTGLVNSSGATDPSVYGHILGYKAPNVTLNFGGDISLTPRLVSTTRLGYYFENYVDAGYPTTGTLFQWQTNGSGATDNAGNALPASLQQVSGVWNAAHSGSYTRRDANKAIQFDQDIAFFKSGWGGTHNFKFGYQLNRLQNDILQTYNMPYVQLWVGSTDGFYSPGSDTGIANCAKAAYINRDADGNITDCAGLYGTAIVSDFGTGGKVTSFNHGLFAQDAWTVGHGVTLNLGIRFDKEYLPASSIANLHANPIAFSWTDKVAPRFGAAWDVFQDGRMKIFGSYGKFFDIMKLNVAISSFGGQYWNDCAYTLDTADLSTIIPAFNAAGRFCPSSATNPADNTVQANWAGSAPAGMTFIENLNYRTFPTTCATCSLTSTGVVPGLKPFEQHETVFGMDYQLRKNLALEVRWDRRRLDHAIEDASLYAGGETFVIGNPGQGVERSFSSFYNFLYPDTPLNCSAAPCPPDKIFPPVRSYDGVEIRLTRGLSQHWFGMFSYTYSRLWGNYTGLTSSDASDGQLGGRSAPNNSRAFDEPYFSYNSFGGSSSGLLPTDRPNTFKGYAYYELGWLRKFSTDFGIFQFAYSGSPQTSYLDVGAGNGAWAVQAWNRGKWVDVSQDPTTGFMTIGAPHTQRLPWFTQTDLSIQQNYRVSESKQLTFSVNFTNLLNQRAVTAVNEDITSLAVTNQYIALNRTDPNYDCAFTAQCRIVDGQAFYAAAQGPYNVQTQINNFKNNTGITAARNSQYGQPQYYQLSRNIRLGVKFTF